jgi:hypothetical protein
MPAEGMMPNLAEQPAVELKVPAALQERPTVSKYCKFLESHHFRARCEMRVLQELLRVGEQQKGFQFSFGFRRKSAPSTLEFHRLLELEFDAREGHV